MEDSTLQSLIKECYKKQKNQLIISKYFVTKVCKNQKWKSILLGQNWSELKRLTIINCLVGSSNIECLSKLQWESLQQLSLNWNSIGDQTLKQFFQNKFPMLKTLVLSSNNITQKGIQYMNEFSFNSQLKTLYLDINFIGAKGVKLLNKIPFNKLQKLSLSNCGLYNEGIRHLTKLNCKILSYLSINCNKFTGQGYVSFILLPLKQIMEISMESNIETIQIMHLVLIDKLEAFLLGFKFYRIKMKSEILSVLKERVTI